MDSADGACAITTHGLNNRNPINAVIPFLMILMFMNDSPFNLPPLPEENG
ncbi:MAG: hypothetical protein V3U07_04540 [Nitrospirales bacterium]